MKSVSWLFVGALIVTGCSEATSSSSQPLVDDSDPYANYDPTPPPSRWGEDDEAGNSNTQTAEKVLEAVEYIQTGTKYLLGHEYTPTMPLFPGNEWAMTHHATALAGDQAFNTETVTTQIAQNGTQFDAMGHFGWLDAAAEGGPTILYYNRFTQDEVWSPTGLQRLGVENIQPYFTRGILLDVARAKGVPVLQDGYEITLDDILSTLAAQSMTEDDITEGDVVLVRTGWEVFWDDGTMAYYKGAPGVPGGVPGIGLEVAQWLGDKQVACVGSDNWGVEVAGEGPRRPTPPGIAFPVHHELLVRRGIAHHESMHLAELAVDLDRAHAEARTPLERGSAYTFAYVFVPVPITGTSGSPGVPMAIR